MTWFLISGEAARLYLPDVAETMEDAAVAELADDVSDETFFVLQTSVVVVAVLAHEEVCWGGSGWGGEELAPNCDATAIPWECPEEDVEEAASEVIAPLLLLLMPPPPPTPLPNAVKVAVPLLVPLVYVDTAAAAAAESQQPLRNSK